MKFPRALWLVAALAAAIASAGEPAPRARPAPWAVPIINSTLENCYRVSDELYRCEQPDAKDIPNLRVLGIRSILNLRHYHTDPKSLEGAGFALFIQRMEADALAVDDL